jgi:serine/threonine-protein kinase HipA
LSVELPRRAVVLLGDDEVGVLERLGEASRFEPSEQWAELPAGRRPVLGQPFEEDPFSAHRARYGAPGWFEHLLPELGGPLRDAIATSLGVAPGRSLALLLALGEDLPGAVRVRPLESETSFRTIARREQSAEPTRRLTGSDGVALPLRVSLAGLQFKISARMGKRGIALPARGEEADWILKFADQRFATLPTNEFLTMTWAKAAGLDVPEIQLVETSSIAGLGAIGPAVGDLAFAIQRYDRTPTGRIHQEDFAQVLGLAPGDAKYWGTNIDTIVRVVAQIAAGDVDELIARLVFCVICGNDDAHAKNWSLWYPEPTRPQLSPAYDLATTVEYFPDNDMSLKLALERRFSEVGRDRFRLLGERAGLNPDHVDEVVVLAARRQLAAWDGIREMEQVPPAHRDLIDGWLSTLRLVHDVN